MDRNSRLASSFGAFLRTLGDLMVLNLLWIACSLPIVTLGPATSALCCVTLKLARGENTETVRTFFTAFRRGFGQAAALGLIGLAGLAAAAGDFYFAVTRTGTLRTVYLVVAVLVSTLALAYWAWAFALHAAYENSLGGTVRNALSLAFVCPGRTLLIWLGFAAAPLCFLFLPELVNIYIGWAYLLFSVSTPAFFAARGQVRVFARFGDAPAGSGQDTDAVAAAEEDGQQH